MPQGYYVWIFTNQAVCSIDTDCMFNIECDFVYVSEFQIKVPCPPFYNEIVYRVRFSSSTKGKNYFVCGPTVQRTEDKNELWSIIKNDNEVYARLISDTGLVESELERRVLELLSNVLSVEDEALAEDAVTGEGH